MKLENVYYYEECQDKIENLCFSRKDNNIIVADEHLTSSLNSSELYQNRIKPSDSDDIESSSYHFTFSDDSAMIIEDNEIIHKGSDGWETCLIGDILSEGVHIIQLRKHSCSCGFGIVDGSFTDIRSGKSISQLHAGVEMKFELSEKLFSLDGIRATFDEMISAMYGRTITNKFKKEDDLVNIFNRSNKKVGRGVYIMDCDIFMEVDLRSEDPNQRFAYFYTDDFQVYTYFFGLPPSVRFAVYFSLFVF